MHHDGVLTVPMLIAVFVGLENLDAYAWDDDNNKYNAMAPTSTHLRSIRMANKLTQPRFLFQIITPK